MILVQRFSFDGTRPGIDTINAGSLTRSFILNWLSSFVFFV